MSAYVAAEREAIEEHLGCHLVDGSLNLILDRPVSLVDSRATVIDGNRPFWPASVSGMPLWLYRPPGAPEHVVELVSGRHLRSTLGLQDGDAVIVSLSSEQVAPMTNRQRAIWSLAWLGRRTWYYSWDMYLARVGSVRRALAAIRSGRYRDLGQQLKRGLSRPALLLAQAREAKKGRDEPRGS